LYVPDELMYTIVDYNGWMVFINQYQMMLTDPHVMSWQYLSYIIALVTTIAITSSIAILAWRQHEKSGVLPFILMMAAVSWWGITRILEGRAVETSIKILWSKAEIISIVSLPVLWFIFSLDYTHQNRWSMLRSRLFLWIIPVLTIGIALTNEIHHLLWTNIIPSNFNGGATLVYEPGPWFWIDTIYNYILLLLGAINLLWLALHRPIPYRPQAVAVLAGAALPLGGNAIYLTGVTSGLDLAPFAFTIAGIVYTWTMLRLHLFDLVPVANNLLIENLNEGIIVSDTLDRITNANPAALTLIGLPAKEVINKTTHYVFRTWPELTPRLQLDNEVQVDVSRQDSSPLFLNISISPLHNHRDQLIGKMIVLRDVTKSKVIENQLRMRSTALESAASSVMIVDKNGIILWANPAFTYVSGYTVDEVIGKHVRILNSGIEEESNKGLWDTVRAGKTWQGELVNHHKTGEIRHVDITIAPVHDEIGDFANFVVIEQNITGRKTTEEALRNSEALYHALVENLPVAIFRKDLQGQYTFVNQRFCHLTRKSPQDILGKTDFELYSDELAKLYQSIDQHVIETNEPYQAVEEQITRELERSYVQVIKAPVYDALGRAIGVQGVVWDITESKHAEQEIKQRLNELATVNDISQASASELDVNALIDLVGDRILDTFQVQSVFISTFDKTTGLIYTPYWWHFGEKLPAFPFKYGLGLTSRVIELGKPLRINHDYLETSERLGAIRTPGPVDQNPKSWLGVPITVGDEVIGVISVQDYEQEYIFTDSDVRLLTTIASNIGIAIKNAQLYAASLLEVNVRKKAERQLQQHLTELRTIFDVSQAAASQLELDALLSLVGEKITSTFDVGAVFIALIDRATSTIQNPYWRIGQERIEGPSIPLGQGLTSIVINSGKPFLIDENYDTHSRELGGLLQNPSEMVIPKTWLGIPIFVRDEVIGALGVLNYEKEHAYNETDIHLLNTIAANLGIAIQNAQLYAEEKETKLALTKANEQLKARLDEINLLQEQLREQAIRDPLTNLFNRRYLQETLDRELARAERDKTPLSMVMMDLDHFKKVNDRYGHQGGDEMLRELAELLRRQTRGADIACRYGGEEFLVVMPSASLRDANKRAEQIRSAFDKLRVHFGGKKIHATLSLGVATYPNHGNKGDEILTKADQALYAAKAAGGNCTVSYKRRSTEPSIKNAGEELQS
jgi:diguanylate cyclase (GGDEF)-like protein/PAS domain S-box-containing protein